MSKGQRCMPVDKGGCQRAGGGFQRVRGGWQGSVGGQRGWLPTSRGGVGVSGPLPAPQLPKHVPQHTACLPLSTCQSSRHFHQCSLPAFICTLSASSFSFRPPHLLMWVGCADLLVLNRKACLVEQHVAVLHSQHLCKSKTWVKQSQQSPIDLGCASVQAAQPVQTNRSLKQALWACCRCRRLNDPGYVLGNCIGLAAIAIRTGVGSHLGVAKAGVTVIYRGSLLRTTLFFNLHLRTVV